MKHHFVYYLSLVLYTTKIPSGDILCSPMHFEPVPNEITLATSKEARPAGSN